MTTRKPYFDVIEIYCKRSVKDCRNCYDPTCKNRTEKYSNKAIKKAKK